MLKLLWSNVCKCMKQRWNETFIIGEKFTKCRFSIKSSDKFTLFTTKQTGVNGESILTF